MHVHGGLGGSGNRWKESGKLRDTVREAVGEKESGERRHGREVRGNRQKGEKSRKEGT